jgi:hypothetical protein
VRARPRLLLDACVLVPPVLREVLLAAAAEGLFEPLWSARILEEWARAAARGGAPDEARARGEAARLRAAFPGAEVAADPGAGLVWPDPADAHVAATARAAGADGIVTLNLRDFPPRAMADLGLRALHPDALLVGLWRAEPARVAAAVARVAAEAARLSGVTVPTRTLLKRAGLPRLGRALAPPAA